MYFRLKNSVKVGRPIDELDTEKLVFDIYDFIDRLSGEAPSNQIFSAPTSGC